MASDWANGQRSISIMKQKKEHLMALSRRTGGTGHPLLDLAKGHPMVYGLVLENEKIVSLMELFDALL